MLTSLRRCALALCLFGPLSALAEDFALLDEEFAKYHFLITGRGASKNIVTFAIDPAVSKSGKDAYTIVSNGAGVDITGSNLRSVWYGLYDLLERRGGCGWFWDGDVVPKKKTIDLSGLDIHEESRFEYRGIRYFAHRGLTRFQAEHWGFDDWKREIDWCIKRRLNLFMLRIGQDDLFQKAFPDVCAYPDASKPLPGAGRAFDNRSLFWPLQFRGKLRKKVMDYAFARGMMSPEDFGTMTHWYSRTPQDFLDGMKPDFISQASCGYGEPSGLVWDIRMPKWMDAYWKLTDTSIREYGRPDILHTIGVAERNMFASTKDNLRAKIDLTNALFEESRRRYPSAKRLFAGWDLYCMQKPNDVKSFLKNIPNDVIVWDYEADAYQWTNFTEWDVIEHRPYTFGIFMNYESGLDPRTDYSRIIDRQKRIAVDTNCVGYILWPESSHVDSIGLEYFTRNAWRADKMDVDALVHGYCLRRYPTNETANMESLWRDAISISTNLNQLWRWNYALTVMRTWTDDGKLCDRSLCPDPRHNSVFARVHGMFQLLRSVDWNKDELMRRDMMDIARTVADRLTVEAENRLIRTWFDWCDGKCDVGDVRTAAGHVSKFAHLMAKLLALHTDYSLVDSLARLNAVHPVANPNFDRVLIDNCANFYCASHQAELAEHLYAPAIDAMAKQVTDKAEKNDRSPLSAEETCRIRDKVLAMPLAQMITPGMRTATAFYEVISGLEATAVCFLSQSMKSQSTQGGMK